MDKSRKVLLMSPSVISQMPLGLGYIAAVFEKKGFDVKIAVNTFKNIKDNEKLMAIAQEFKPDVIGISFLTLGVLEIYRLLKPLKDELNIPLIAGGVHPSAMPEEALDNGFDIVVRGEGESTVADLCDHFENGWFQGLDKINGISYRLDGKILHTPPRERIHDLDSLPFPARHLFDQDDFTMPDGSLKGYERIFIGRGCPSRCTFCESALGREYRHRSVENAISELRYVKDTYGITRFTIGDDTFSLNKKLTMDLCQAIIDNNLDITWTCGARVNSVDPERLAIMKRAGCETISFGAESGDEETLKLIKKGQTVEQIERAIRWTYEAGINVYLNVMTGFPWETPKHVENTIKMIESLSPMIHIISVLGTITPVPGTEIYETCHEEYGFTKYWLRDDPIYQNAGQALFQNVVNPYELSVFYQRNMYDDIYVVNDTFFKYTREYKKKVRELCFVIGRHNLKVRFDSPWKRETVFLLGKLSRMLYEANPMIEKGIVGLFKPKNELHNIRSADIKRVKSKVTSIGGT